MSVHDKLRIPPHKHFRDEVVEAKRVRPNRPAYKGVHWTDTIIDGTLTLDETNVDFTRQWEEDTFVNLNEYATIVADAKAKNGYALKVESGHGAITEPFDTPMFDGEGAEIYCIFRMKVASNASSTDMIALRLIASGTQRATRILKPSDFTTSGEYQIFAIKGRVDANDTNVYCDIYGFQDITDLYIDWVSYILANVPLGTQDTETDAHSGTDTNVHSGTNTNAHSGTDTNAHAGTNTDAHGGSTSANTNLSYTNLLSLSLGTEQNVVAGSDFTLIRGGTASAPTGGASRFRVYIYWVRGSTGGVGRVQFALHFSNEAGVDVAYTWWEMVSGETPGGFKELWFQRPFSSAFYVYLYGRCQASENVYVRAQLTCDQENMHTHSMTNPNNHSITQPSNHSITQPSNHSVTQPSNHTVTQPSNHVVTNPAHEH